MKSMSGDGVRLWPGPQGALPTNFGSPQGLKEFLLRRLVDTFHLPEAKWNCQNFDIQFEPDMQSVNAILAQEVLPFRIAARGTRTRAFAASEIGRASCRERVCQYG